MILIFGHFNALMAVTRTIDANDATADYASLDAALTDIVNGQNIQTLLFTGQDQHTYTWSVDIDTRTNYGKLFITTVI